MPEGPGMRLLEEFATGQNGQLHLGQYIVWLRVPAEERDNKTLRMFHLVLSQSPQDDVDT